jgi:hypothetical protein
MVVMHIPNGPTAEYRLVGSKSGLRLVRSCASYDLLTMVRDAGWRIVEVKTDLAWRRLRRAFGPRAAGPIEGFRTADSRDRRLAS